MKFGQLLFIAILPLFCHAQFEPFSSRVVATGLQNPWEITMGPDNYLWVTERTGKRITRVHPYTGVKATAITITEVYQTAGQDGLLGMALHPNLLKSTGEDYVYAAYTYDAGAGVRRARIIRLTYNNTTNTLGSPVHLITNLPASNDHNSGRLKIGPDGKLYYTIGDQGANQFDNKCVAIKSQMIPTAAEVAASDWTKYAGKILRINLDGSIPADNPVINGTLSHIFSYGHRNAQGLAFAPDGKLYADEHGPKTDDEINLIEAGKNYGWPRVAGYRDDKAYVYGNWSAATNCNSLTFSDYTLPASVPTQTEASFTASDFTPPIKTLYTVNNGHNFQDPECSGNYFICWPTIGPSSLDIYAGGSIGSWSNSLLVVSLKEGRIFRLKLSGDGSNFIGDTVSYFRTTNRYRDITMNSSGTSFYIVTDNSGSTSGPTSGYTATLANPGSILEFHYEGILLPLKEEGSQKPAQAAVSIYPNPVHEGLTVRNATGGSLVLSLYNSTGMLVKETKISTHHFQLDMQVYRPGLYILKIADPSGNLLHTEKLIRY